MAMAMARMHVNSDSSLLDEVFGLHSTSFDGAQRQGLRGFRYDRQTDSGDNGAA